MSSENKLISICIPAYRRPENIRRLLQSISEQVFTNYEIVITDDSPDESVHEVVRQFSHLHIIYYKNEKALGTPSNWNFGISKAKGEWIKIMHDDDWFFDKWSLQKFHEAAVQSRQLFIFSEYMNVFENGRKKRIRFPYLWRNKIIKNPMVLLARNVVGPPSVTLIHCSIVERYDDSLKWRVDMEYYIRLLKTFKSYHLLNETLIKVGIGDTQVTNDCINHADVELPEGYTLLNKYGVKPLNNILVYDAWWRIFRNTKVKNEKQLSRYGQWPQAILNMLFHQKKVPEALLNIGFFSKIFMSISYFLNKPYLK